MTALRFLPRHWLRLLVALLCCAQIGHVAHAAPGPTAPDAKSVLLCGHVSLQAVESLAWLAPDEYGKSLRQLLGSDAQCQVDCGTAPVVLPASDLTHAPPEPGLSEQAIDGVPLGASRFGRLRPPSTAPPRKS